MATLITILVAFLMVIWSIRNWYLESLPFIDGIKNIPSRTTGEKFAYCFRFIGTLPAAIPIILDVTITLFAVANLGFGGGLMGGITGLFLSNLLSIVIMMKSYDLSLWEVVCLTLDPKQGA